MGTPLSLRTPIFVLLTGLSFSGKTTVAKALERLFLCTGLDCDEVRRLLFPNKSVAEVSGRKNIYRLVRNTIKDAALLNWNMGHSVVANLVLPTNEAKELFLDIYTQEQGERPFYIFDLVLPEDVREDVVRLRAQKRHGTDEGLVNESMEHYEFLRRYSTPWPSDARVIEINAAEDIEVVCRNIIGHIPELQGIA